MVISTIQREHYAYDHIDITTDTESASILLGDTSIRMQRETFERLLFAMQCAVLDEEYLGGKDD